MIFDKFPFRDENAEKTRSTIINSKLNFKSSKKRISNECKDLLIKLLDKDP